jgi:hypothetical protein
MIELGTWPEGQLGQNKIKTIKKIQDNSFST